MHLVLFLHTDRINNPQLALQGMNIRDIASINELAVLSNLESSNADMMRNGIARNIRFQKLYEIGEMEIAARLGPEIFFKRQG